MAPYWPTVTLDAQQGLGDLALGGRTSRQGGDGRDARRPEGERRGSVEIAVWQRAHRRRGPIREHRIEHVTSPVVGGPWSSVGGPSVESSR
jgi:hypothetical protein